MRRRRRAGTPTARSARSSRRTSRRRRGRSRYSATGRAGDAKADTPARHAPAVRRDRTTPASAGARRTAASDRCNASNPAASLPRRTAGSSRAHPPARSHAMNITKLSPCCIASRPSVASSHSGRGAQRVGAAVHRQVDLALPQPDHGAERQVEPAEMLLQIGGGLGQRRCADRARACARNATHCPCAGTAPRARRPAPCRRSSSPSAAAAPAPRRSRDRTSGRPRSVANQRAAQLVAADARCRT